MHAEKEGREENLTLGQWGIPGRERSDLLRPYQPQLCERGGGGLSAAVTA